ncbi:MAG TPA: L-histidine N(alpha)-methyltransferase [Gemmatimonadaceae bacterium]|jgi:L-histidine N-alpha-methyltransferase|nr:L-histidine N(alpha)-methyltransferase [Gemmatimonadaceae bacterium]
MTETLHRTDSGVIAEVWDGLHREPKELSPKYFYDQRGSQLFEEITRLPEYYLTRAERGLLHAVAPTLVATTLVELGAGNAEKTRILLDAMSGLTTYVPVDVSATFLADTAEQLRAEYPRLRVSPIVADITHGAPAAPARPALYAFLGSTIGNFSDDDAVTLLSRIRARMKGGDRLLLGADLVKDHATLDAAYNDSRGVTAEFNRNILYVVGRELGVDFHPELFEHLAFYNAEAGRIEMHLMATRDLCISIPDAGSIYVRHGESIRTEISNKYDRRRLTAILGAAGLRVTMWNVDERHGYALVVAE